MYYISDEQIDRFLCEDMPYGDLTTHSLGLSSREANITFSARADIVVSCTEEAARIMRRVGCVVELAASSGSAVKAGQVLLSAYGPAEGVFGGWKVCQVLMEYASGVATATAELVKAARSARADIVVACTRKHLPGVKSIMIKAIVSGGATPHRLGLSDTVLVFPQHRELMEGVSLEDVIRKLKATCPEKKMVIEVTSVEEAENAVQAGADVIQLEKFSPEAVAAVVRRVGEHGAIIAVAGGVNVTNAAQYASTGAQMLVTSAPYAAPPCDINVIIAPVTR